jgi:PAS domain S-box-containing protein
MPNQASKSANLPSGAAQSLQLGTRLGATSSSTIYRGRLDGTPVLVKRAERCASAAAGLALLRREQEMFARLADAACPRPVALVPGPAPSLALEDRPGEVLEWLLARRSLSVTESLEVCASAAAALSELHASGLLHGDLCPANLLVDLPSGRTVFLDLGSAREQRTRAIARDEGDPAYFSPERTSRVAQEVDGRSDLYSLGVLLYRMLTGQLPFATPDALEVHDQIAQQPRPPAALRAMSRAASDIAMKLLAKSPEARYQSALGLAADLETCLAGCRAGDATPLALGTQDVSERLRSTGKLYGREREQDTLLAAFHRVAASGAPELVLVAGHSGIGKSSLVHEVRRPMAEAGAHFGSGKFDPHSRGTPYAALEKALGQLVQQKLANTGEETARWRGLLLEALGSQGQLMVELVPQLTLLVGLQPPVPPLPPVEAQHRFQRVFLRFLRALASPEHPLVLFLDDLQWADLATLALLEHLASQAETRYFLVIGAYRDNEVGPAHPLARTIAALRGEGVRVETIFPVPLALEQASRLVADALGCDPSRAEPLTRLILGRTEGNPFFFLQFLAMLAEEGLLSFDRGRRAWTWDLDRIEAKGHADDVAELMASKLRQLPDATRHVLRFAACFGNGFDLEDLALVSGRTPRNAEADLGEAVGRGFLRPTAGRFHFPHDRVQEAAYALVEENERARVHLGIGRLLLARAGGRPDGDVFEVVSHLKRGATLLDAEEKVQLAELALAAGRRAHATTAYRSAAQHFGDGQALLPESGWRTHYELSYALALERARCEWLCGGFAAAERWIAVLMKEAQTRVHQAEAYRVHVDLLTTQGKVEECVRTALEACAQIYGLEFPLHPSPAALDEAVRAVLETLGGRGPEQLLELPAMADPGLQALLALISSTLPNAFFLDPLLVYLMACEIVRLSLRHGNGPYSSHGYASFALILGHRLGRWSEALGFSRLACDLAEARDCRCRVATYFLAGMLEHQVRPPREAVGRFRSAWQAAVDGGDANHGWFAGIALVGHRLMAGDRLADVAEEARGLLEFPRSVKYALVHDGILAMARFVDSLRGNTERLGSFDGPGFAPEAFEARLRPDYPFLPEAYHGFRAFAELLAGDFAAAMAASARARPYLQDGHIAVNGDYRLFAALAAAGRHDEVPEEERRPLLEALREEEDWLRDRALRNPETFGPRLALVAAEVARVEGRDLEAMCRYDEAIASAREGGFVHVEALTNEAAARFYRQRRSTIAAAAHLRVARDAYQRWGAVAKVKELEAAHPELRAECSGPPAGAPQVDFLAAARASQAISGQIVLERLLEAIVRAVVESAGAQTGFLLLPRGDELTLAAHATAERDGIAVKVFPDPAPAEGLPRSILSHVRRSREPVMLADAASSGPFCGDGALRRRGARSLLCLPIVRRGMVAGLLYLENNLVPGAFGPQHLAVLELLAGQAAISLENGTLYRNLERENAERERAEGALRENRRLMQAIFDNANATIFVRDTEGRFLFVNRTFEVRHRISNEQARGKTAYELFPRELADAMRECDRRVLATGVAPEFEVTIPLHDGPRTFLSVKAPIFGESGKPCAVCVIATDITERKRAEAELGEYKEHLEELVTQRTEELTRANRELEQAHVQLLHAEKMASIGRLAAGVAHEINNPVAFVNSNLGSVEKYLGELMLLIDAFVACEDALPPERKAALETIKKAIDFDYVRGDLPSVMADTRDGLQRVTRIIHGLREFSHPGANAWEVTDLHCGLDSTLNLLRNELAHKATVMREYGDLPAVECLPGDLNQVFMNLLVNAAQAIRGRGTVTVRTGCAGDEVWVEVEDSGEGIAPENLSRIFEPFFTTKPVGVGTGLGLALSYRIVKRHQGRIEVGSELGRGSKFRVVLPVRQPAPPAA